MKLIQNIIILVLFLTTIDLSAQKDTVIDNTVFSIHVVQPRETLYAISRNYNTELNTIVVNNPFVIQGLNIGQKLLIPKRKKSVTLTNKKEFNLVKEKTKYKEIPQLEMEQLPDSISSLAFILPFYLNLNDTLRSKNPDKNVIYPKSKTAIDYFLGAKLAMDTLELLNYSFDYEVYDVPNDSVFHTILDSNLLDLKDIVFGPLYVRQFQALAEKYGYKSKKQLVSPLSYKALKGNYINTYQLVPVSELQMDTILKDVIHNHADKHLVLLGSNHEDDLVSYVNDKLSKSNLPYVSRVFETDEMPERELVKSFLTDGENIVLVPSNKRSFVSRILPMLASMKDTSFTVYGLDSWNRFDNLDYHDLMFLNLHLPTIFFKNESLYQSFVRKFYKAYDEYPSSYSWRAYKQVLFFVAPNKFDFFYDFIDYKQSPGLVNNRFKIINFSPMYAQ